MGKATISCDAYGKLKAQQVNGKQAEISDLLGSFSPQLPGQADIDAILASVPNAEGLAKIAESRWSHSGYAASQQWVLDAFAKLHENGGLKPAAKAFFEDLRAKLENLLKASIAQFGHVEGAVYDEVYGEGADKSTIAQYLPAVSHFQLVYHELCMDKAFSQSWLDCLTACGVSEAAVDEDMGSTTERRVFMGLLSLTQDIAFTRLAAVLLFHAFDFQYE